MKKVFHLSTCSTCKRIISELDLEKKGFIFRDLKGKPITQKELQEITARINLSFEELFNKRAMKYSKDMFTTDAQFKKGLLEEYTFLKRPIILIGDEAYVGNSKSVVEAAKKAL